MSGSAAFSQRGLAILISVGLASGIAFALLSAFGPPLALAQRGGTHALSNAGTGFAALVALAEADGLSVRVSRNTRPGNAGLLVLTPEDGSDPAEVARLVAARGDGPTLIILPKWLATAQPLHPGWIEHHGRLSDPTAPLARLAPGLTATAHLAGPSEHADAIGLPGADFAVPRLVQTLKPAAGLDAMLTTRDGVLLAWQSKHDLLILVDPDLVDNAGLRSLPAARSAVGLLRSLGGAKPGGVVFDVTLNGIGGGRDLLRVAFEPPFLGLTLALLGVAALAVWQAAVRFGTPALPPPAILPGKRALIDNIAALVATAGREGAMAPRYTALVAATVAQRRHAPPGLSGPALGAWLDAAGGPIRFSVLAHDASLATTAAAALASARAAYLWHQDLLHDRR